jgi:hypothetical protein
MSIDGVEEVQFNSSAALPVNGYAWGTAAVPFTSVGTAEVIGSIGGTAMSIQDEFGVNIGTGGVTQMSMVVEGTSWPTETNSAFLPYFFRIPAKVATDVGTKSTCSDIANVGSVAVFDDTNDALPGAFCVCMANSAGTYAWRLPDAAGTACPL